ncbi:uncharacterized protein K452DRAFT_301399 [Aplosporella prunicola CBS 121167]|uniref:Short-chain dehydrogenase/reductase 3 n=1 Tax=Aplosporella prunicola CBS 121167 TaxID=1176127 RepID=A0A6A6B342_9PEZI|nr:uncharacterized protein K452DRAFT_301399 [Aplosporella prunicola CBS 121167]KAF2138018.1 hypothetical protein K452DRAFT_301399 [Aplosporella prunicola CBS 121167]
MSALANFGLAILLGLTNHFLPGLIGTTSEAQFIGEVAFPLLQLYIVYKNPVSSLAYVLSRWRGVNNKVYGSIDLAVFWINWIVVVYLWVITPANEKLNRWARNKWLWEFKKDPLMRFAAEEKKWKWPNEIAVITGASNGIGAFVAQGLAAKGMKVAVLDVQPPAEEVLKDGPNITYFECDITSPEAVCHSADMVRSTLGQPSILINNAGVGNQATILDLPPAKVQNTFNVNVVSHWYTIQAFLPDMIAKKKGHVVTVASTMSYVGNPTTVDYNATKAALLGLHDGLNLELKHVYRCPEIKTTIFHPHWTKTRLIDPFVPALQASGAQIMEPQQVADAILKQVFSGQSGQVFVPEEHSCTMPILRALPTWLYEWSRDRALGA